MRSTSFSLGDPIMSYARCMDFVVMLRLHMNLARPLHIRDRNTSDRSKHFRRREKVHMGRLQFLLPHSHSQPQARYLSDAVQKMLVVRSDLSFRVSGAFTPFLHFVVIGLLHFGVLCVRTHNSPTKCRHFSPFRVDSQSHFRASLCLLQSEMVVPFPPLPRALFTRTEHNL